jgi:hypothetical protein
MPEAVTTSAPQATTQTNQTIETKPSNMTQAPVEAQPGKDGGKPVKESDNKETSQKRKIVVDKQEFELTDEQLIRFAQKGAYADKELMARAKERKELQSLKSELLQQQQRLEEFWGAFENDPFGTIRKHVKNQDVLRSQVEPWVLEQYEYDHMDPKEKAALEAKKEAERYKQELENIKKSQEEQAFNQAQEEQRQIFEQLIIKGLQAGGIAKTPKTVGAFANYLSQAIEAGHEINEDMMGRIANAIKEDTIVDNRELLHSYLQQAKAMEAAKDDTGLIALGKEISSIYGEELVKIIRKTDLAGLRAGQPSVPKVETVDTPKATAPKPKSQYIDWDTYRAMTPEQRAKLG